MKKKIILFVLIILLIYAVGGISYILLNKKKRIISISDLDSIKGYNYTLKSNATSLYTSEFNILKDNIESENINEEEYAQSVSKLFIIDLYTLSNKINKYDIGGTLFVHPDYIANYKLNVQDTLYKYIEDNSTNNRNQELPEVTNIEIVSCEETIFKIGDNDFNGYKIKLTWNYNKDLGYDNEGEIIVIKIDNLYYVVEKN